MKISNISKFVGAALLLFSSCNNDEFFELQVPPNPPVLTVADMERAVAGTYYALTGDAGNATNFDVLVVNAAAISDEARFVTEAGGSTDVLNMYNRDNSIDNGMINSAFSPSYSTIANANEWLRIIENRELVGLPNDNQLTRQGGELYFLRAHAYWMLLKMFAPAYDPSGANDSRILPLRLSPVTGLSDANAPAAATAEIYAVIVDDLLKAKRDLPEDPTASLSVIADATQRALFEGYLYGRATKYTASALLARVYMQMGKFDEALAECDYIISSGRFVLEADPLEAWNKSWQGGSREVIWEYSLGDGPQRNGLGGSQSNWKLPRRYSFFNYSILSATVASPGAPPGGNMTTTSRTLAISDALLNAAGWLNADRTPSAAALRDKRFQKLVQYNAGNDPVFNTVPQRQYWANKYWRGPQSSWRAGAVPQIRIAEIYLNRAIIRFTKNDRAGAAADLNVVKARAWDEAVAGAPYTPVTADQVTAEMIHNERFVEMMFEGDRPYYLQSQKVNIPNGDRGAGSISWNASNLYWLLPLRERELNQGLGGAGGN